MNPLIDLLSDSELAFFNSMRTKTKRMLYSSKNVELLVILYHVNLSISRHLDAKMTLDQLTFDYRQER